MWSKILDLEYDLFITGRSLARPTLPKAAVIVKPSLPARELAWPHASIFATRIFLIVASRACNRFSVTLTRGSDIGHGLRSRHTPMTIKRLEGSGDFSIDISHPVSDVKQIQASLADAAVDTLSTDITSSTQLVVGTAHSDAMTSAAHSGYRLKFNGALMPPKS